MPLLKRRSRLVTFRVSADEYDNMTARCIEAGARSIAEFSRTVVLDSVQAKRCLPGTLSGNLTTLSQSLAELDAALVDLRKKIRTVLGTVNTENGSGGDET